MTMGGFLTSDAGASAFVSQPRFPNLVLVPGDIAAERGEDEFHAWVNSENQALDMARLVDSSASAKIRALGGLYQSGAEASKQLLADRVKLDLRRSVGFREVNVGDVFRTPARRLARRGVRRLYHVISVDRDQKPPEDVARKCVPNLLEQIDRDNLKALRPTISVLMVVFGTGAGGLPFERVFRECVDEIIRYFETAHGSKVKRIGISCFSQSQVDLGSEVIEASGLYRRMEGSSGQAAAANGVAGGAVS